MDLIKVAKPNRHIKHETLYYLTRGYDFKVIAGHKLEMGDDSDPVSEVRKSTVYKMCCTTPTTADLTKEELGVLIDFVGEAVSIKAEHVDAADHSNKWTKLHQEQLTQYLRYLNAL